MPDETAGAAAGDATATACHALRGGAVVIDRSDRRRMRFTGPGAADTLNGLVTNEVTALVPGRGQYALALTPKGKIVADARILAVNDGLLVDVSAAAGDGWSAMIRKYVNPRLARYADVSAELGDLGVAGAAALAMLRRATGSGDAIPDDLPAYGHVTIDMEGAPAIVARVPDFGLDGFDVFAAPATLAVLHGRLRSAGAVTDIGDALLIARIEAGRPEWGTDMDDSTLAQEADMDRLGAISFTKGCYTGQETVARVHFRGHVNRLLRGLHFAAGALPPAGTELVSSGGKPVGTLSSVARSPEFGGVGLGLVRREIEPGSTVLAGEIEAIVVELPFRAGQR